MHTFHLRTDLERFSLGGYALPLGLEPGRLGAPTQGYTIEYTQGQDDEPDSYSFHICVSHDRLRPVLSFAFDLLPDEVVCIMEVESNDAYRAVDVFLGLEPISKMHYLKSWKWFEPFLMEDCYIGAGANSEDPFVEVYLDQWKRVSIHIPLSMRDEVEAFLTGFGLEEIDELWPAMESDESFNTAMFRPVLELEDEFSPDLDEMIHDLRHAWNLELNVDSEGNPDERGRELGMTLWHVVCIVQHADGDPDHGAYAVTWVTAGSMSQVRRLIMDDLLHESEWIYGEVYTIERVAYDDRPEELTDLAPRRSTPEIHSMTIETWNLTSENLADD